MLTDVRTARIAFVLMPTWWLVALAAASGPVFGLLQGVTNLGDLIMLTLAWFFVAAMMVSKYWFITVSLLAIVVMVVVVLHTRTELAGT